MFPQVASSHDLAHVGTVFLLALLAQSLLQDKFHLICRSIIWHFVFCESWPDGCHDKSVEEKEIACVGLALKLNKREGKQLPCRF